jgi:hypothetical protein
MDAQLQGLSRASSRPEYLGVSVLVLGCENGRRIGELRHDVLSIECPM